MSSPAPGPSAQSHCIIPPTCISLPSPDPTLPPHELELSLFTLPKSISREFNHIFPSTPVPPEHTVLIIPTIQPSSQGSLLNWSDEIAAEKDRLLELFFTFAQTHLPPHLPSSSWHDYIDPCSGLPMRTQTSSTPIYDEVASFSAVLQYPTYSAGNCRVFAHPRYGEGGYPASCFVVGEVADVKKGIEELIRKYTP